MPYLIFDIEGRVSLKRTMRTERLKAPDGGSMEATVNEFIERTCLEKDRTKDRACFAPARFHEPVSVVMLLVDDQLRYISHQVIDHHDQHGHPEPAKIAGHAWEIIRWARKTHSARLVTFAGCRYDIPVLEATAFEHGMDIGFWFNPDAKVWENGRSDRAPEVHLDLLSVLTGPSYMGGGLNFWSRLCGLPGKLDTEGDMVQEMLRNRQIDRISDYCLCDVLNTYGLLFHMLFSMRQIPASHTGNPIFRDTLTRMIAGRGPEAQRFEMVYSEVPF